MRKIKIYKGEEDSLYFILTQFIATHKADESLGIYNKELKLSERLVEESIVAFAKRGNNA